MSVDTKVIERVITIAAPPETVFAFLTEPELYVRWKGRLAQLDPHPGGVFRVEFAGGKDIVAGRFVEVIPPRRVVFTWGWEGSDFVPPGASTVEIELEPAAGGTRLTLLHRGLPEQAMSSHAEGWDHFMPRLADVAEGREPQPENADHTDARTH